MFPCNETRKILLFRWQQILNSLNDNSVTHFSAPETTRQQQQRHWQWTIQHLYIYARTQTNWNDTWRGSNALNEMSIIFIRQLVSVHTVGTRNTKYKMCMLKWKYIIFVYRVSFGSRIEMDKRTSSSLLCDPHRTDLMADMGTKNKRQTILRRINGVPEQLRTPFQLEMIHKW